MYRAAQMLRKLYQFAAVLVALIFCSVIGCGGEGQTALPPTHGGELFYGKSATFIPPEPSGNFFVGTREIYWQDETREEPHTVDVSDHRELLVRLFYPAASTVESFDWPVFDEYFWPFWEQLDVLPNYRLRRTNYQSAQWSISIDSELSDQQGYYPLVIFSHGYGLSPEHYLYLAAELASRGFIVASINHPYGAGRTRFPDGRVIYAQSLPENDLGVDLNLWSDDQMFVIDQLVKSNEQANNFLFGRIDSSKIAIVGHSYGGAAGYYAASKDARIAAVVDLDGTLFDSEGVNIAVPFLFVQAEQRYGEAIFSQVASQSYQVYFKNHIKHLSFLDYCLFWRWDFPDVHPFGDLDSEVALQSVSKLLVEFIDKAFYDAPAPLLDDVASRYPFTEVYIYPPP